MASQVPTNSTTAAIEEATITLLSRYHVVNRANKTKAIIGILHSPPEQNFTGEALQEANRSIFIHATNWSESFIRTKMQSLDMAKLLLKMEALLVASKEEEEKKYATGRTLRSRRITEEAANILSIVKDARGKAKTRVASDDSKLSHFLNSKQNKNFRGARIQDEKSFDDAHRDNQPCPGCGHHVVMQVTTTEDVDAANAAIHSLYQEKVSYIQR